MFSKLNLFIFIILIHSNAFCQTYDVSMDDRNKTVDLTNNAINELKDNRIENGILLLKEAIKIDSTFRPSFINLYKAYLINKTFNEELIGYLKKGLRIFKEDDELHFYLGEVYKSINDYKSAFAEYDKAISFSKKNGESFSLVPSYYFNRGNCFLKLNDYDSAIKDYNYAIKLKPIYSSAILNRGICHYKKGNVSEACSDWTLSLELGANQSKEYIQKYCK